MKIKTGLATGMMAVNEQSGALLSGARYDQVTRSRLFGRNLANSHQRELSQPTWCYFPNRRAALQCIEEARKEGQVGSQPNRERTHRPEAPKPKAARTPTKKAKPAKRPQQAEDGTRQQERRSDSV